jgi:hypothetical protein
MRTILVLAVLCNKGKRINLDNFSDIYAMRVALTCFFRRIHFRYTMKKSLFDMTTVVQDRQAAYTCWNWTRLHPQVKGWGPTKYPVRATTMSTNQVIINTLRFKSSGPIWTYGIPIWGTASNSNIAISQRYHSKVLRAILNALWNISNKVLHADIKVPILEKKLQNSASSAEIKWQHTQTNL